MIGVFLFHTAAACNRGGYCNSLILSAVGPFYVNAFFVVSGYLFFRKWLSVSAERIPSMLKTAVENTLFRLILPTILFATIIYIPKLFYHNKDISGWGYLYDVLGGISFWFTSAMAIGQLFMLALLRLGINRLRGFIIVSLIVVSVMPLLELLGPSPFPWYWKTGLMTVPWMTLGGLVYWYRKLIYRFRSVCTYCIAACYLIALIYSYVIGGVHYAMMSVSFNAQGVGVSVLGIAFVFMLAYRAIPSLKFFQFIGEHSIVFYFLSGVIPATLSSISLLHPIGWLGLSVIAVAFGFLLTWVIVTYLPFLTDFRKLWRKE
jgi:fucose 4-O-acetylase-like acetyltransferase